MFTSRGAGCGSSAYGGFNICHYTGDSASHVADCRRNLAEALGVDADRIIVPRQTHSVNVAVIDSFPPVDMALEGVDGVVSILNKVVIGVSTADCVPVILVDEIAGVVAALHAGWRGAVGGIVRECVSRRMETGAAPDRIMAYIGPSICVDCFEVGEEVAEKFPEECVVRYDDGRRPHVDLPRYVALMLEHEGIKDCNITPFAKN
ncbi:MAG: polyphenol oxidase family protein, partial [Duncaniella sp.]|nr:polyphenol oxidase family protein [Duncaniella sp.]